MTRSPAASGGSHNVSRTSSVTWCAHVTKVTKVSVPPVMTARLMIKTAIEGVWEMCGYSSYFRPLPTQPRIPNGRRALDSKFLCVKNLRHQPQVLPASGFVTVHHNAAFDSDQVGNPCPDHR